MSKNNTIVSLSAVSNKFLNNDNHLNIAAVKELEDKVQAIVKGLPVTNAKGKVIKQPLPEITFTVNRRKKVEKFDSAKNNRGDLNYLAKRAIPVKQTKRLTERGSIRNMALLTIFPADKMTKAYGEDPFAKLRKTFKEAQSAFTTHMKRADKTKDSVKNEKTKIRDASNKAHGKSLTLLYKLLDAANFDRKKDMVESSGMGGKAVLLRLGKEEVISIGKSDITKFKAAVKKAAEADDEDEAPAKKKVGKKVAKADKPVKKVKKVAKEEKAVKKVKKVAKADKTEGKKKLKKKAK
ncbi:MAG: hypothetical protein ABWX90_03590 [Candidatus Saccharimonadales bacterium]